MNINFNQKLAGNMEFKKVSKRSRTGMFGKIVMCPKCNEVHSTRHFSFSAIRCRMCKGEIDKYDYLIPDPQTMTQNRWFFVFNIIRQKTLGGINILVKLENDRYMMQGPVINKDNGFVFFKEHTDITDMTDNELAKFLGLDDYEDYYYQK